MKNEDQQIEDHAIILWHSHCDIEPEIREDDLDESTKEFFRKLSRAYLIRTGQITVPEPPALDGKLLGAAFKWLHGWVLRNALPTLAEFDDMFAPHGVVLRQVMGRLITGYEETPTGYLAVPPGNIIVGYDTLLALFQECEMWRLRVVDLEKERTCCGK